MKTAEDKNESLIKALGHAFDVLGDGWITDPVMNNMFDECVKAGESYAKERAIDFLLANLDSEPITDKDIRIFYENVYDEWITPK